MQYNQEHQCWNSLTPLSRQLHIFNILMRQEEKRRAADRLYKLENTTKYKVPRFLTQALDQAIPFLELLAPLYVSLCNRFVFSLQIQNIIGMVYFKKYSLYYWFCKVKEPKYC